MGICCQLMHVISFWEGIWFRTRCEGLKSNEVIKRYSSVGVRLPVKSKRSNPWDKDRRAVSRHGRSVFEIIWSCTGCLNPHQKKKKSDDSLVTTHLTERHSWIFHSSRDYFFRETGSICDRVVCWRRFRGGQRGTRRSGETTKKKEIKMKESKLPSKIRRMQLWTRMI